MSHRDIPAEIGGTPEFIELEPLAFTHAVAEQICARAKDAPSILVSLPRDKAPFFAGALRHGMTARLRKELHRRGSTEGYARETISPHGCGLANKIQTLALLHDTVTLTLRPADADLFAQDIAAGLSRLDTPDTRTIPHA